ncbi:MAG TPA: response regulator transcription factor [Gaiellaceae bacterium]|nr:response regulator transcription factor [Gaiellaceae bacterium]
MEPLTAPAGVAQGYEALASGDWAAAREAFEAALEVEESPEALDGLGRASWWLREAEQAVVYRERAYSGFRRDGELARAARIALWLSREYALVWGNEAAANGWLARAERLLTDVAPDAERGWLELARAERAREPVAASRLAASALAVATSTGDADLELRALAQLGLAEVSLGEVEKGLARLDEAMAAATGGEPATLETFADVCCTLMLACELAGDAERPRQWSEVFEAFVRKYDHVSLLAFCRTCCADVYAANGRVDAAEHELIAALRELEEAGQRARCVHPAARLAEIRVFQGRFDEAEQLLDGFETEPEAVQATVALRLASGEPQAASALLETRLSEMAHSSLLAAPLLSQLVEARLVDGEVAGARLAAAELETIAETSGRERIAAFAALARGRVAVATEDPGAVELLQRSVNLFAGLPSPLGAARARLELARAQVGSAPQVAVDLARRARTELEALGAVREADAAAALMRDLGAKGRAGPKDYGLLSRRELEVLRLVGEGLTNGEIATRLFISTKTVEHHMSRIYSKLRLRTRTELAAYAVRHLWVE